MPSQENDYAVRPTKNLYKLQPTVAYSNVCWFLIYLLFIGHTDRPLRPKLGIRVALDLE